MKLYNIFRMNSETTYITINLQNWFQKFSFLVINSLREGFKKKLVEFSTKRGGGGSDRPIFH